MRSEDEISPIYLENSTVIACEPDLSNQGDEEGGSKQKLRKDSEINITNEFQVDESDSRPNGDCRPQSNYKLHSYRKNKLVNGHKHKRILKSSYMSRRLNSESSVSNIDIQSNLDLLQS